MPEQGTRLRESCTGFSHNISTTVLIAASGNFDNPLISVVDGPILKPVHVAFPSTGWDCCQFPGLRTWVDFGLDVPPSCPVARPILPNSRLPKQNRGR